MTWPPPETVRAIADSLKRLGVGARQLYYALVIVSGMAALGQGGSVLDVGPFGFVTMLLPEARDLCKGWLSRRSDIKSLKSSQKDHAAMIKRPDRDDEEAEPELPLEEEKRGRLRCKEEEDGR